VTYFEDLSGYTYCEPDRYSRLNVGWLDAPHTYAVGAVPEWVPAALLEITAGRRVNVMRGFHVCTLCPPTVDRSMLRVTHGHQPIWLGHAEIRVPAQPGRMFAAPTLIWHYVTAHQLPASASIHRCAGEIRSRLADGSSERMDFTDAERVTF
jgi:hypothetical protein